MCVHLSKTPKELMERGSLNHPGVDGATEGCRSVKVSCLAFYSCCNLELTDTVPESWGPYSSKTMLGQYYLSRFCGISLGKKEVVPCKYHYCYYLRPWIPTHILCRQPKALIRSPCSLVWRCVTYLPFLPLANWCLALQKVESFQTIRASLYSCLKTKNKTKKNTLLFNSGLLFC